MFFIKKIQKTEVRVKSAVFFTIILVLVQNTHCNKKDLILITVTFVNKNGQLLLSRRKPHEFMHGNRILYYINDYFMATGYYIASVKILWQPDIILHQ